MTSRIENIRGDITTLKVDAIVNAANIGLLGGGGVDGDIHRAAGPGLLEDCKKLNGCKTGEAKITNGYDLPAKFVIHTVGPIWEGGYSGEDRLLSSCYLNSLRLAVENQIKSLAFPAISTGVFGFPPERAAKIALKSVRNFLLVDEYIEKIIFVCFDEHTFSIYEQAMSTYKTKSS
jgi:O-acetyl-ADP-ribose deacetylase (regulator of RNase III)